ncbi:MAG: intradiol Ring-Cleavage Dioxygenase [Myxococcaceae bacterium]|nr:intradiol Ring-Cleavage Dioxygenase [Myxococcaceae bacterium]
MNHDEKHDLGLQEDLQTLHAMTGRRQVLRWFAVAALLPIVGCPGDDQSGAEASSGDAGGSTGTGGDVGTSSGSDAGTVSSCARVPEETEGPYPGDGSNGKNALILSGIVRSDIKPSFAGASGTAEGVALTVKLTLVASNDGCTPLQGYAVYLWHCDRDGNYSMYSAGVTDQNYLRGVQETDSTGTVTFSTIFPACYSGRWPHIHFEIYPNADTITSANNKVATSQLAMPEDACKAVFASTGYSASVTNLQRITLATDNVFSDGATLETPTMSGSVADGYVATMRVGVQV